MKILGIIVAILVIGGGAWFISQGKDTATMEGVSTTETSTQKESDVSTGDVVQGSPEELARKGGKYICTFDMKDPNAESSGTVYIEGEKFRGDFKSVVKALGQTIESHSISDTDFVYTWTSASPLAMKTPVVKSTGANGTLEGNMNFASLGAQTSWKCTSAKFDASVFAVPAGMQFIETPKF